MKNKFINILFVIISLAGLGAIMAFSLLKKNDICEGTELHINGSKENAFLTIQDVNDILNSIYVIRPGKTKTSEINTERLEQLIRNNAWVNDANVYFSQKGKLMVELTPKQPEVRLFNGEDLSYYLDSNANGIPLSASYVADVPLFTIDHLNADLQAQAIKAKILYIGKVIKNNEIYNALIEQVHIESPNKFVCYTSLANHPVILGDTNNLENKLARLSYFYAQVMPHKGWDAYSKLDLSFNSQVVAEKSNTYLAANPIKKEINNAAAKKGNVNIKKSINAAAVAKSNKVAVNKEHKDVSKQITITKTKPNIKPKSKESKPNKN